MTPGVLAPHTYQGWSWPGHHVSHVSFWPRQTLTGRPPSPHLPCAEPKQRRAHLGACSQHSGSSCGPHVPARSLVAGLMSVASRRPWRPRAGRPPARGRSAQQWGGWSLTPSGLPPSPGPTLHAALPELQSSIPHMEGCRGLSWVGTPQGVAWASGVRWMLLGLPS